MNGLTADLLGRACRTFLTLAYPDGNVPSSKLLFADVTPETSLDILLAPPVCQALAAPGGGIRGYAFRLGSTGFPHIKLQAVSCGDAAVVFQVDTHDAMKLEPGHPDAPRWAQMQTANRQLKQQIERAWEAEGLVTFNGLLKDGLHGPQETPGNASRAAPLARR